MRQSPQTCAITILTHQRKRLFQRTANAEVIITTLLRYRNQGRFALHTFVIMPDHIHILITPAGSTAKSIQFVKGGFSHAVREHYKGEVWHTGYHEHRIRDRNDFAAQKQYIVNNPIRKAYENYPHVHTNHPTPVDPPPSHLS